MPSAAPRSRAVSSSFSARRATAYTRTAMSNKKGQASRMTPGLSQHVRKTHQTSQARRTDGQAIARLIGTTADHVPFPATTLAREIHFRLKNPVACATHFVRPIARTSVRRRVAPEVRAPHILFLPFLSRPRNSGSAPDLLPTYAGRTASRPQLAPACDKYDAAGRLFIPASQDA